MKGMQSGQNIFSDIHRLEREKKMGGTQKSRILVIKAADDAASQYMSFMNVIFAGKVVLLLKTLMKCQLLILEDCDGYFMHNIVAAKLNFDIHSI